MNEVQNQRLPSLEAQFQAFEQSHAQVKGTSSQILSLKERLDAVEAKEASLETLGQKYSSASTRNAASIQSLSTKIDKVQADQQRTRDVARRFESIPPNFDWASISSALDSVKTLSAKVEHFHREKDADARTIQDLSKSVKKLQAERDADLDRVRVQSERLDKLQSQVDDGEHTSKLEAISQDLEKLQADRDLDSSRLQKTSENLNKLQSQQAEKASRLTLNVLNEKVAKMQAHQERDRTADTELLVKKHNRKLEDRLDQTDKQIKQLSEQSRKTEAAHSGMSGVTGALSALARRVEHLESRPDHVVYSNSNATINTLFVRINKLESRDANIAKVNAESQTMLKRVEKLAGEHSDVARVGANLQALVKRVQSIEDQASPMEIEKRIGETGRLLQRLEKRLRDQDELTTGLNETLGSLLSRVRTLEGQRDRQGLQDQSATTRVAADLEAVVKRVNGLEADGESTRNNFIRRLNDLEDQSKPTHLVDVQTRIDLVEPRLDRLENHKKEQVHLSAQVADLQTRIDTLESQSDMGTSDNLTSNGNRLNRKTLKPVDISSRSVSTVSADVISAKESIEGPSTYRNKQKHGAVDKQSQVHVQSSNRTRAPQQDHEDEQTTSFKKSPLKRTFDMTSRDNAADKATTDSRKRSRSEAAKATDVVASSVTQPRSGLQRFRGVARRTAKPNPFSRRTFPGRHTASSPVENSRSASRRKEVEQDAGATDEQDDEGHGESEDEDEESEDEIAPRRTSRTVKPTERGSHLNFLDVNARRNS